MTTIAYHHDSKLVAYDSRTTSNGYIVNNNADKSLEYDNGMVIIGSGDRHSVKQMADMFVGISSKLEGSIEYDTLLLVIANGSASKVGFDEGKGFWVEDLHGNTALGSGAMLAISAMDFGCSATEAVEYAKTRDTSTGGDVRTVSVIDTVKP